MTKNFPLHLLLLNSSKDFVKGGLNFRLIGFISEYTERVKHIVFYPVGCGIKIIPIVIPDVVCSVDGHNQHDNAGASRYGVLLVCGIPGVDAPYGNDSVLEETVSVSVIRTSPSLYPATTLTSPSFLSAVWDALAVA